MVENKKLANLIKDELQDILTNENRWGEGYHFFEYEVIGGRIWVKKWEKLKSVRR